jgi:hypothetical protein
MSIKIYQGGSTGLVQQDLKNHPENQVKKKEEHIFIAIKGTIKNNYGVDLVLLEGGQSFYAVDEDADLMNKEFGHKFSKKYDNLPYNVTAFPVAILLAMYKKIEKTEIKYAILSVLPNTDPVMREVMLSSEPKLLRKQF